MFSWMHRHYICGDSRLDLVQDRKYWYYWKANKGGTWHTELVDEFIRAAEIEGCGFDLVGANSPQRGLFKRAFGGRLTPYYAVTTSDTKDLREPDARHENLREVSAGSETAYTAGMQAV